MGYTQLGLLVAGEWHLGGARDALTVVNPATGEVLGMLPVATDSDLDRAIDSAHDAFAAWSRTSALERGRLLARIGASIREQAPALAVVLTLEQGKTLAESMAELAGAADTFEWMAEEGKRVYGRVVPSRLANSEQLVLREPVGPVGGFTPWNSPAVLAARKIATALAAGCTIVLKAAEEAPGICVEIARLCMQAGVPAGVVNLVFGVPDAISRRLIASPKVKKLSFTGSVPVGRHLLGLASAQMKKITLELGGHSPVIVDRGIDVDRVAALATAARFRNAGQACHGPTRFIVHAEVHDRFCARFAERAGALRVGNGMAADTQMGPLIHARRVAAMRRFTDDAVARGGRLLCGGRSPAVAGSDCFWLPTVIADAPHDAQAMREEVFGPIALVTPYDDLDAALALANSLDLGLGAYAFSNSLDVVHRVQCEIRAGNLSVNTFSITPPEVPFSGIGQSGMGCEMGIEGLLEHCHTKTVLRAAQPC
jgi:succinate-semialdehyde dehydrogenase/glutarate-semialdehyde dehydrogenase